MTVLSAIAAEARADHTLLVLAGLGVAVAVARLVATAEERRMAGVYALVALHVVAVAAAGILRAQDSASHPSARLVALLFAALAAVGAAGEVVFDWVLPRLRLRAPRILRDVLVAGLSIVAAFVVVSRHGVDLSAVITTSAVVTAVIGLSLQDTLGNVMGGLALQMDNSIRVGDWVKVGDVSGRVTEIRWRYTAVETRNWETVFLPNSVLMRGQVTVLGRRLGAPLQWRRWVWFNVDYRWSPADVIAAVEEALRAAPMERVAADPSPNCILMEFHESTARYAVRYWLTDFAVDDPTDSQVRTRVYFALKRAGIPLSIPAHAVFLTEESATRKGEKVRADLAGRVEALAGVELFERLSDSDRARLAEALHFAPFAAGETITRQGAEGHWLYLLRSGEASVRVRGEGLEREVGRLGPGDFFGEMSLMTGEPRAATVVALGPVECWRLEKASFQEILHERPELAEHVAEVLVRRREELEQARTDLDHEAAARRRAAEKDRLAARIRKFFGVGD